MENPPWNHSDEVRAYLQAYESHRRETLERLLSDDFHFKPPHASAFDRAYYFQHCWPKHQSVKRIHVRNVIEAGDKVFVDYDVETTAGEKRYRTEVVEFEGRKIRLIEAHLTDQSSLS